MPQRTAHRRHQALDRYLADEKIEDICRHVACAKSWLYKWRKRYDAANPAWVQERSTRPQHSPTRMPEHVVQAIVSLHEALRHNGTGGGAPAIMQGSCTSWLRIILLVRESSTMPPYITV